MPIPFPTIRLRLWARGRLLRGAIAVLAVLGAFQAVRPALADSLPPITLRVDATEAPLKVFHARLVVPAAPGPLTLLYPEWIPGEHAPTGPITDLAGLKITAAGATLAWRRDPLDMYAFHCEVPAGASAVEVALDYLSPPIAEGFSGGASATARMTVLSWNQVLLYPAGRKAGEITYAASLRLPRGWKYGTALPVARESADGIDFSPVPLVTLVDSPVLAGEYFRTVDLTPGANPPHSLHIASDNPAALEFRPERMDGYRRLVAEANALFGARHYRAYHFLLSLSDQVAHFGLEHHESSDNRTYERALIDDDRHALMSGLLSHEMVHSWNGKYRRPADLATSDYHEPMQTGMLWVYEGLTTYLGDVLAARSGLRSAEEFAEHLAMDAAMLEHRAGRTWRPLEDTAVAAQLLYEARGDWANWRRRVDFYPEGELIWLEADVILRRQSKGRRSLDDFCRLFYGAPGGPPIVKTYTFDDVVAALNEVAPYDWKSFLTNRLTSTDSHAPLGGIQEAGWRLVYKDTVPKLLKKQEEARETTDVSYSLGLELQKDGTIKDVEPGLPAARAGIAPSMKLIAVNGRKYSRKGLREVLKDSAASSAPIEILVENAEYYTTYRIDYHGGERYPYLERDPGRPDLLSEILKPLAGGGPSPTAPGR